jgi:hypothetical protein
MAFRIWTGNKLSLGVQRHTTACPAEVPGWACQRLCRNYVCDLISFVCLTTAISRTVVPDRVWITTTTIVVPKTTKRPVPHHNSIGINRGQGVQ